MKIKLLLILFVLFSVLGFSQNEVEYKNKGNLGWAYYGRGNGVSLMYDRELNPYFSIGVGVELYFIDEEKEGSYFSIFDFHLKEPLNLPRGLDVYPGFEFGVFEQELGLHYYLGVSQDLTEKIGVYTEIGSRGVLGVFLKF